MGNLKTSETMLVKWLSPPDGWFTLNFDGAAKGNPGNAGVGGLIQDSLGRWVQGYYIGLGITTSVNAELRGLLEGLKLASQLNITQLIIELDALVVISLVQSQNCTNSLLKPLLLECRKTLKKIPLKQIKHVFREVNGCADFLANLGAQNQCSLTVSCSPPVGVIPKLHFDCSFAVSLRKTSCNF